MMALLWRLSDDGYISIVYGSDEAGEERYEAAAAKKSYGAY